MSVRGRALRAALVGSTALVGVAVAGAVFAAEGGAGGVGDANIGGTAIGTGGRGGDTGVAGATALGGNGGAGGAAGSTLDRNGTAGSPGASSGSPIVGGAGGGGGGGLSGTSEDSVGGNGGNGGNAGLTASSAYGGGGGGAGGNGVDLADFSVNFTPSVGGRGGNGGNASSSGGGGGSAADGGAGGGGGYGIGLSSFSITNTSAIQGGSGGNGGAGNGVPATGVSVTNGNGGAGGAGGQGVVASIANIFNSGSIAGGNGGQGGLPGSFGAAGAAGAGGVGIQGDFLTIVNSGSISGGLAGDGVTRANAITFTGGTNRLTLEGANYSVVGNVQAASRADTLSFNSTADQSFALANLGDTAQYRGFGRLTKEGNGTLTVFGTSDFNGTTTVNAGTLSVTGFLRNSPVTVNAGGTLIGNAAVGGLTVGSGGVVAPGRNLPADDNAAQGRFDVNGNVTFGAGSIYRVTVNTSGADLIQATGSVTLQGGRVEVNGGQNSFRDFTNTYTYTILRGASVAGQFAELTSDLAFLTPSLNYAPDRVDLVLNRNGTRFRDVAATPNQQQVADAAASLGITDPVTIALLQQNPDGARAAFDLLNGEAAPSSVTAQLQLFNILGEMMLSGPAFGDFGGLGGGLGGLLASGGEVEASYAADVPGKPMGGTRMPIGNLDPRMYSMWGTGFGSFGSTRSDGNAGTMTRGASGFVVGVDATFDRTFRIGLAAGYTAANFDIRTRGTSGDTDTGFGAIYGGTKLGPVTIRLGVLGAGMSSDTRRAVVFPGFANNLRGRFGGTGFAGFGEVGYRFDVAAVGVEPFLGGSVMRLSRDGYTETGGAAALTVLGRDYDIQTLTVGARASTALGESSPFTVRGALGYRRAFGDVVPRALLAFASGGTQFQTAGIPVDVNALVAEAGIAWQATRDIALEIAYTGQVGSRAEDHGIKGSFQYRF